MSAASTVSNLGVTKGVISAKTLAADQKAAAKSLSEILSETAGAISRPVLWVLEACAMIALGFALALLPMVHDDAARSAVGIAAGYFTLSSFLGGYLLLIKKDRPSRRA